MFTISFARVLKNNEAALCFFGGLPGAMLKAERSTDSN